MKNDLAYWEKNKEYLQKHFLDWEEFVCAEKLPNTVERKTLIGMPICFLILTGISHIIWIFQPMLTFWTIVMYATYFIGFAAIFTTGYFQKKWIVLTTRAIYLCYGEECELIFDCSYSSLSGIIYQRGRKYTYVRFFTKDTPIHSESLYRGLPWKGRKILIKIRLGRFTHAPVEHRIFSLSVLCGITSPTEFKEPVCCYFFPIWKDSEMFRKLLQLTEGFPRLRRKEFPYVTHAKMFRDFIEEQ